MHRSQKTAKRGICKMHPFAPDFSTLTDAELAKQMAELNRKLMAATRGGSSVVAQMRLLNDDYLEESNRRADKKMRDMLAANNKSFDDIIDIG